MDVVGVNHRSIEGAGLFLKMTVWWRLRRSEFKSGFPVL